MRYPFIAAALSFICISALANTPSVYYPVPLTPDDIESLQPLACALPFSKEIERAEGSAWAGNRSQDMRVIVTCSPHFEDNEIALRHIVTCSGLPGSWKCSGNSLLGKIKIKDLPYEIVFDGHNYGFEEIISIARDVLSPTHTKHNIS